MPDLRRLPTFRQKTNSSIFRGFLELPFNVFAAFGVKERIRWSGIADAAPPMRRLSSSGGGPSAMTVGRGHKSQPMPTPPDFSLPLNAAPMESVVLPTRRP
jgi:hypothetical protein